MRLCLLRQEAVLLMPPTVAGLVRAPGQTLGTEFQELRAVVPMCLACRAIFLGAGRSLNLSEIPVSHRAPRRLPIRNGMVLNLAGRTVEKTCVGIASIRIAKGIDFPTTLTPMSRTMEMHLKINLPVLTGVGLVAVTIAASLHVEEAEAQDFEERVSQRLSGEDYLI